MPDTRRDEVSGIPGASEEDSLAGTLKGLVEFISPFDREDPFFLEVGKDLLHFLWE
jgi:hypothetical protein